MKLTIIKNGYMTCDKNFITEGKDEGKKVKIPVYAFLIQHEKGNVLIDSGISTNYQKTWGRRLEWFQPEIETDVVQAIKGITIDYIINTHLHLDHAENNNQFPEAEIIVQKDEYDAARRPLEKRGLGWADEFDDSLKYKIVEGTYDLFNDGSIVIEKTEGHTEGHQSVTITINQKKIFFAGDACYSAENLIENLLPSIIWNKKKTLEQYEKIRSLKDTIVVYGHDQLPEELTQLVHL